MDGEAQGHPSPDDPGISQVENLLHERTATLQALLHGVRDYAIYTLTPEGRISSWHLGAELMMGYSAEDAVGMSFAAIFTPEDCALGQPEQELEVAIRHGEYKGEGQRVRRDGSRFDVAVVLTALRGPRGELLGFLKLTQDITARRAGERALAEALRASQLARAEAERASHSKGEFLATLSHELRTPLSAILGWAHVLDRGVFDAATLKHGLDAIARNARQQVQLIEDLLDMTRIETGQMRLDMQRIELGAVLAVAVDSALPTATARGLVLRPRFGADPGWVMGDAARLQQVVGNLLDNAMKFTPRGGRVEVSLTRSGDRLLVTVADTGQGIEPAFLPRLFDRFQQQDATTTRRHGGLGIGLAIVRQLVLRHGGSVEAHSAGPGRGATFIITLPALAEESVLPTATMPAGAAATADSRLDEVHVLLVDDEADVRDITARILTGAGAKVSTAATAAEGLQRLVQDRPDVLLSDIGMPGEDGYDLIRRVRALPPEAGGGTPAAAFTAYAGREDAERALSTGYQLHLAKPVAPDALVSAVVQLAAPPA
ncbi:MULTISPECIES: hybrid sensor histidine kinase/response regulator [Roseateles]|uniref:histidine kinase n=1 Tax=Pelomonas caseinilytica TaxID=2906763 RepID=A0ABS8X708_9BURK|nr:MULTISPECIES: ATP-binding protein [unclassified Roseateles]MCE4536284.1 ATP-binding protein [Pelomonas sp. P7]HEV6968763.1 ATP-binding protein [Roseateles sp.]